MTSQKHGLSYYGTRNMEDTMIQLTDTARKELDTFFADKKKDPIRIYLSAG